nr:C-type lectin mannose-binding isoform-like isoform X2 [Procambarus clarkii]
MALLNAIAIVLSLAAVSDASIIFDVADVEVTPGQTLTLSCGVRQEFRHCLWENERGDIFQVEDVHAGVHPGLRAPEDLTDNQCGVVIDSVSVEDLGAWTCRVFLAGRTLLASRNVGKTQAESCPDPFVLLGGQCYYFHTSTTLSWQDAREYCWSMDTAADLAVVDDCHQFAIIWDHILIYYTGKWFWVGGTDLGQEGEWYFINGNPVPMGLPFWLPGSPNDEGNCLDISVNSGYFNDYPCVNKGSFICQIM